MVAIPTTAKAPEELNVTNRDETDQNEVSLQYDLGAEKAKNADSLMEGGHITFTPQFEVAKNDVSEDLFNKSNENYNTQDVDFQNVRATRQNS